MKKRNRGQISVYVCAMLGVFLILLVTILQGIRIWEGKAKCAQAVSGVVDSIKGDYQPDLFRRYHLFALDKTYYGKGEGYLEERAIEYLNYNLNPSQSIYDYQVQEVALTNTVSLTENNLSPFKKQIQEYMELKLPINLLEEILNLSDVESFENQEEFLTTQWNFLSDGTKKRKNPLAYDLGVIQGDIEILENLIDPRKAMEDALQSGILYVVMPEQAGEISREAQDFSKAPSTEAGMYMENWENPFSIQEWNQMEQWNQLEPWEVDKQFDSDMCSSVGTQDLYGIAYALDSFQYAGNAFEDEEYHALEYEVEYLIAGKNSDYANMTEVAERICLMRFVTNGAYAFSNETMQEEALLLAAVLLTPVGLAEAAEPVSYVLLACWAYGESLLDVKALLQGESVPIIKDKDTWQLSLNGLMDIATEEVSGTETELGDLNYESYLILLLAMTPDTDMKYYRMLDIMQWNIQEDIPEFEIEHCICGFQLQVEIVESEYVWHIETEGSYY